jgi:hypothetical protein
MRTINITPNYETTYRWLTRAIRSELSGIKNDDDRKSMLAILDAMDEIAVPAIKTAAPIWKEKEE